MVPQRLPHTSSSPPKYRPPPPPPYATARPHKRAPDSNIGAERFTFRYVFHNYYQMPFTRTVEIKKEGKGRQIEEEGSTEPSKGKMAFRIVFSAWERSNGPWNSQSQNGPLDWYVTCCIRRPVAETAWRQITAHRILPTCHKYRAAQRLAFKAFFWPFLLVFFMRLFSVVIFFFRCSSSSVLCYYILVKLHSEYTSLYWMPVKRSRAILSWF